MKKEFYIIKTTYPKLSQSKKLANNLLTKKLSACVQFSKIESSFLWENKICHENEILVTIKAKANLYKRIEKEILEDHPYEIPQIIAIEISDGFQNYLNWLSNQ